MHFAGAMNNFEKNLDSAGSETFSIWSEYNKTLPNTCIAGRKIGNNNQNT